jgi:hypothetical protein
LTSASWNAQSALSKLTDNATIDARPRRERLGGEERVAARILRGVRPLSARAQIFREIGAANSNPTEGTDPHGRQRPLDDVPPHRGPRAPRFSRDLPDRQ